jgi:hypothetical protein
MAVGLDPPSEPLRRLAASAWRFRWSVELEAEARFLRIAGRLEGIGAAAELVDRARRASSDEARHATLCAGLAFTYGEPVPVAGRVEPPEIAPPDWPLRERVLYELVAACCISETESLAVLTTLLESAHAPALRSVLHQLASDEVGHARLGWAHLAGEHSAGATAFLGPLLPAMLEGSVDADLFRPVDADREAQPLLLHGVLPHRLKGELFARTLEQVVFPGLETFGVDTEQARAWLAGRVEGFS